MHQTTRDANLSVRRFALLGCVGYARDLEGKEEGKALEEVIVRTALLPDDLVRYLIEFVGAGIV